MRLSKVRIERFRSIEALEFSPERLTALIGANNAGKSAVVSALRWALDSTVPLSAADIPITTSPPTDGRGNNPAVTLTFIDDGAGHEQQADMHVVRRVAKSAERCVYEAQVKVPVDPALKAIGVPRTRDQLADVPYGSRYTDAGRLDQTKVEALRQQYLRENASTIEWATEFEETAAPDFLPTVIFLPAVRDLTDITGEKSKSAFRRLIAKRLKSHLQAQPEVDAAVAALNTAFSKLNETTNSGLDNPMVAVQDELAGALSDWGVSLKISVGSLAPPNLLNFIEPSTTVYVDDGTETLPSGKGHGFQRTLLLELVRLEAKWEQEVPDSAPRSTLLLVEEPEIFLHPQKQRMQSRKLREIANSPHHQVVLTTHSPYFVDLNHPRSIVMISRGESASTQCRQLPGELFSGNDPAGKKRAFNMAYWFSQGRAEMLFARRVVFVEGPTEMALFPMLAHKLGVFSDEVTLVDCASKDNLVVYCEVADALGLDFTVVHDQDPVPSALQALADSNFDGLCCEEQQGRKREEYREKSRSTKSNADIVAAANGRPVHVFEPDLEAEAGISRSRGRKASKQLAAVEKFEASTKDDIPEKLRTVIEAIYGGSAPSSSGSGDAADAARQAAEGVDASNCDAGGYAGATSVSLAAQTGDV